ncbi:MAG TPA: hypothetical protein VF939_03145 [Puia sp.]
MEKRIKYGTILLIFLIISLLVYGYFYHISQGRSLPAKAAITISARDLTSQADRDEPNFDHRYLYKILSVGGVVKDIKRNKSGNTILSLEGNPGIPSSVDCTLDSLYNRHPPSLKAGDSCSIRGTCAGHLSDVILVECIIERQ